MESSTAGAAPTAAPAALDLLLRMWGGRSHTAEVCDCLRSVRTDVLHDVSLMHDVPSELLALMSCVRLGVNTECLLADDCCGDHRERQGRCEEV